MTERQDEGVPGSEWSGVRESNPCRQVGSLRPKPLDQPRNVVYPLRFELRSAANRAAVLATGRQVRNWCSVRDSNPRDLFVGQAFCHWNYRATMVRVRGIEPRSQPSEGSALNPLDDTRSLRNGQPGRNPTCVTPFRRRVPACATVGLALRRKADSLRE